MLQERWRSCAPEVPHSPATFINTSCKELPDNYKPDVILVDEASQVAGTEIVTAIANFPTAKCIMLVGDEHQLQPHVSSKQDNEFWKSRQLALFERLVSIGMKPQELDTQYRITRPIADLASRLFYDNNLKTDKSVDRLARPLVNFMQRYSEYVSTSANAPQGQCTRYGHQVEDSPYC